MPTPHGWLLIPSVVGALCAGGLATAGQLAPRPQIEKPRHTVLRDSDNPNVLYVKINDGSTVRLRGGRLVDLHAGVDAPDLDILNALTGGLRWERVHQLPETKLDELRSHAQTTWGRAIADLNLEFHLHLPPGVDTVGLLDALNALECVEIAMPTQQPAEPPTPPDFFGSQGHLKPAPGGMGFASAWDAYNIKGAAVKLCDIEYTFNKNHIDFPTVTTLGSPPVDPGFGNNHGTAALGLSAAIYSNMWGTTGGAPDATFYFKGTWNGSVLNVAGAVTTALGTLGAGDVILIEAQMNGPNFPCFPSGCGYVPVEWDLSTYNAVVTAVGNGITVVEAAGNGYQNLDAPIYAQGNGGHWPFLPENDSGAIMVGAGAVPSGSDTDRSRLPYSNYGSRLNVQGWGENVWTCGYGDLYAAEGANAFYTKVFAGTSSGSATIAAVCGLMQSAYESETGEPLSPLALREALVATGSPQQSGDFPASQKIGPRPNIPEALAFLLAVPGDVNKDGSVDGSDLGLLLAAWGTPGPGDLDKNGVVDGADLGQLLSAWTE